MNIVSHLELNLGVLSSFEPGVHILPKKSLTLHLFLVIYYDSFFHSWYSSTAIVIILLLILIL